MSQNVVHIVPALFGYENVFGGGERYALELARNMAEQVPTILVSFGGKPQHKKLGNLDIYVLRNWVNFRRFKFDPINPLFLSMLSKADVLHYHQSSTMMATLALLYTRLSRKPIFSTHLGGSGYGLHRLTDVTDWYSGHLHISQFSRHTFGHDKLLPAKVILGGVDVEKFSPDANVERTDEVLYVGRLLPHKGINYLIEAIPTNVPLTIIGRYARWADRFYKLLHELSSGKRVTFCEDCDDAAIINAYRRALCIVLPSVHETVFGEHYSIPELLGQTLLEGMACGTPAIATNVTSLPEVVEDGVTGFVVPPNDPVALADKIEWLRQHPIEARQMGEAARSRVLDLFTWDRVVDRCLDAYQKFS
jgi:glycosyltransferase involved in cell wall biosynthesis